MAQMLRLAWPPPGASWRVCLPGHRVVHRMRGVQEPAELDRADAECYEAPAIEARESLSDPLVGTFSGMRM